MNRSRLQAMRHYVRKAQETIYKTRECIEGECNNCDYAYICGAINLLIEYIQQELDRYDVKGELKDDNN